MAIIRSHLLIITLNINESNLQSMHIGRINCILDLTPKTKATIRKNKMGPHQTKKHLPSKGNHLQNQKATYAVGENIYKSYIWWVNIQCINIIIHTIK